MRAAAFSLGVLAYVMDAVGLDRIQQVSSVSGGSLTNGFLANRITGGEPMDEDAMADFARRLARGGIPLERLGRMLAFGFGAFALMGLILTVLLLTLSLLPPEATSLSPDLGVGLGWALLPLVLGVAYFYWLFRQVPTLVELWVAGMINEVPIPSSAISVRKLIRAFSPRRIATALLKAPAFRVRRLRDINSPIRHVFSSTDLRHGEHFHFSQRFCTSETYGVTGPGEILVHEAVQASAAFPGALPPVRLPLSRLSLPPQLTVGVKEVELVDGGVRDNMGHLFQTLLEPGSAAQRRALTSASLQCTIVVDSSAPRGVADLSETTLAKMPLVSRMDRVVTFPRVLSIMNQSNSEARSRALGFRLDQDSSGILVRIQESPYDACVAGMGVRGSRPRDEGTGGGSPNRDHGRASRAETALDLLASVDNEPEAHWNEERNLNAMVPTTLDGLGADRVESLVRHGYVSAMCLAHIHLSWPLQPRDKWSKLRFRRRLNEDSSADN